MTKRLLAIFLATIALAGGTAFARTGIDPGPQPQAGTPEVAGSSNPNLVPIALPAKVFKRTFSSLKPAEKSAMVQRMGMKRIALEMKRDYLSTLNDNFKVTIPREKVENHIRDQQQTGRCWQFATTSVIEAGLVAKKAKPQDLSESFANHHAWTTRARNLLTKAVQGDKNIDFEDFSEGGWFSWASQLIDQHGMVPQRVMPDTVDGANTASVIAQMKHIIVGAHVAAEKIKGKGAAADKARATIKKNSMKQITNLLDMTLGKPPRKFVGDDGKTYTPHTYAKKVLKFDPNGFVVLSNIPADKMAFNKGYKVPGSLGLKSFPMYNVSEENMEKAVRATIDKGNAVWFSTQVGSENPYITDNSGSLPAGARNIMHLKAFDYDAIMPTKDLSKRARMNASLETSNHAMTFTGYDPDSKNPSKIGKLQIDNSWGTSDGYAALGIPAWDGHLNMYRDFFQKYVDTVVVPKSALSADFLKKLEASKVSTMPIPYE